MLGLGERKRWVEEQDFHGNVQVRFFAFFSGLLD